MPVLILVAILTVIGFSFSSFIAFLIGYVFPLFICHPNLKEYRSKHVGRFGFVNLIYSSIDFIEEKTTEVSDKYKAYINRHFTSILFYGIFFIITWPSIFDFFCYLLGVVVFEAFYFLYRKKSESL